MEVEPKKKRSKIFKCQSCGKRVSGKRLKFHLTVVHRLVTVRAGDKLYCKVCGRVVHTTNLDTHKDCVGKIPIQYPLPKDSVPSSSEVSQEPSSISPDVPPEVPPDVDFMEKFADNLVKMVANYKEKEVEVLLLEEESSRLKQVNRDQKKKIEKLEKSIESLKSELVAATSKKPGSLREAQRAILEVERIANQPSN